ncbi:hypothetical protein ACFLRC_02525 [Candidatus Altiarchaeota archaeon]
MTNGGLKEKGDGVQGKLDFSPMPSLLEHELSRLGQHMGPKSEDAAKDIVRFVINESRLDQEKSLKSILTEMVDVIDNRKILYTTSGPKGNEIHSRLHPTNIPSGYAREAVKLLAAKVYPEEEAKSTDFEKRLLKETSTGSSHLGLRERLIKLMADPKEVGMFDPKNISDFERRELREALPIKGLMPNEVGEGDKPLHRALNNVYFPKLNNPEVERFRGFVESIK